ncbi:hypothetical protein [Paraburkholderia ginsengiterrae]|uniref:hypothetical protein n=1 Tax=Paraburkholderia ginsengiterrae TaxID=1462993 RepID=UPI0010421945|nr:hypothetical protein [Paraburkholderia ginsengiterrae]
MPFFVKNCQLAAFGGLKQGIHAKVVVNVVAIIAINEIADRRRLRRVRCDSASVSSGGGSATHEEASTAPFDGVH